MVTKEDEGREGSVMSLGLREPLDCIQTADKEECKKRICVYVCN